MKNLKFKLSAILLMAVIMISCNCNSNSKSCSKKNDTVSKCDSKKDAAVSECASKNDATTSECASKKEKSSCCASKSDKTIAAPTNKAIIITMADFNAKAESLLNQNVSIKGWVSHICSHSGRKCFITNKDESIKIRVEAKGEINGFEKELAGSEINVMGVVRINKITAEFISQWEAKVKAKVKDIEEGGKHCASEIGNINKMKTWMADNKKDFYPIYFIDGMSYEEIK